MNNSAACPDAMNRCSRCGLCLPSCPVYAITGLEADSPRGLLMLAKAMAERRIQPDEARKALGNCVLCGRCAKVCPAQIPLTDIFFAARRRLHFPRLWEILSRQTALRPRAADFLQPPLALAQRIIPQSKKFPPLALTAFSRATEKEENNSWTVLFFPGCITRRFFPRLAGLCLEALQQCGYQVLTLPDLPCCGRPLAVQGQDIAAIVRRWLKILAGHAFEFLAAPCPGCLHAFTRLWPSLPGLTEEERQQTAQLASRCRNVLELTAGLKGWHGDARLFWHRPCLETDQAEKAALALLGDYEVCLRENACDCCGAALHCLPCSPQTKAETAVKGGMKYLTEWRQAPHRPLREQLPQRIASHARTQGAAMIATSCPGCKLILNNMKKTGSAPIPVRHPLEILLERPASGRNAG